jgi:hypothetical protein
MAARVETPGWKMQKWYEYTFPFTGPSRPSQSFHTAPFQAPLRVGQTLMIGGTSWSCEPYAASGALRCRSSADRDGRALEVELVRGKASVVVFSRERATVTRFRRTYTYTFN